MRDSYLFDEHFGLIIILKCDFCLHAKGGHSLYKTIHDGFAQEPERTILRSMVSLGLGNVNLHFQVTSLKNISKTIIPPELVQN